MSSYRSQAARQTDICLELTTQHNILGERYACLILQPPGPWSFLVTLLALQLKLFVMPTQSTSLAGSDNLKRQDTTIVL